MKLNSLLSHGAIALILWFPLACFPAAAVLAESGTNSVTTDDIQRDALRIPAEIRRSTLAKPEAVQQLSNHLIVRSAFAAEAEAAGIANDPAVQSAMRIARERVLSDLLFARMDAANKPSPQVVE